MIARKDDILPKNALEDYTRQYKTTPNYNRIGTHMAMAVKSNNKTIYL